MIGFRTETSERCVTLVAEGIETSSSSGPLLDPKSVAAQAREMVDAAASLIDSMPELNEAFERLHDALDAFPKSESSGDSQ
jgi:hypothetical protein